MKGIIFVELLAMAESLVGEEAVDDVLDNTQLSNDGAFTAVGNYPCSDLVALVGAFSDATGHSGAYLQSAFGRWIFRKFTTSYREFFTGKTNALEMLEAIESEVHVEVKKLYPEAELPIFKTTRLAPNHLEMIYKSDRPLVHFCEGMIIACLEHFGQKGQVSQTSLDRSEGFGARFTIQIAAQKAA